MSDMMTEGRQHSFGLPGDMIRMDGDRKRKRLGLHGTDAELYEVAREMLIDIGFPHLIPATYADCVADVRVCPLCGETDCDNC